MVGCIWHATWNSTALECDIAQGATDDEQAILCWQLTARA